jgi:hypothetical protein
LLQVRFWPISHQSVGFLQACKISELNIACKISQLNIGEAVVDGFDQFQGQKKQHHHLAQQALVSEQLENQVCSNSDFGR